MEVVKGEKNLLQKKYADLEESMSEELVKLKDRKDKELSDQKEKLERQIKSIENELHEERHIWLAKEKCLDKKISSLEAEKAKFEKEKSRLEKEVETGVKTSEDGREEK